MNIYIKSIAKTTAKATFTWIKVFIPGLIFSIICFIISLFLLSNNTGGGFHGASGTGIFGAILGFFALFTMDFFVMLLLTTSLIVFPVVYFIIANKSAVQSAISSIWKNNLQGWLTEKISVYAVEIFDNKQNALSKANDLATAKLQLIDSVRHDSNSSKWQKRILSFIMKKIKLDDIDFSNPDNRLSDVLIAKANNILSEFAKPGNKPFYLIFSIHLLLLILAFVFDQK